MESARFCTSSVIVSKTSGTTWVCLPIRTLVRFISSLRFWYLLLKGLTQVSFLALSKKASQIALCAPTFILIKETAVENSTLLEYPWLKFFDAWMRSTSASW